MEHKNLSTDLPISINKKQCITQCNEPNTTILHPLTLKMVSYDEPFCAVVDNREVVDEINYVDTCNITEETKNKNIDIEILIPTIPFDSKRFLEIYYDIKSYFSGIEWFELNKFAPLLNRKRVLNFFLFFYCKNNDITNNIIVETISEIIKYELIDEIYDKINKYIGVNNNRIKIERTKIKKQLHEDKRIRYIKNNLLTNKIIKKFLMKYYNDFHKKWDDIKNHIQNMENEFINFINKKIIKLVKK